MKHHFLSTCIFSWLQDKPENSIYLVCTLCITIMVPSVGS